MPIMKRDRKYSKVCIPMFPTFTFNDMPSMESSSSSNSSSSSSSNIVVVVVVVNNRYS